VRRVHGLHVWRAALARARQRADGPGQQRALPTHRPRDRAGLGGHPALYEGGWGARWLQAAVGEALHVLHPAGPPCSEAGAGRQRGLAQAPRSAAGAATWIMQSRHPHRCQRRCPRGYSLTRSPRPGRGSSSRAVMMLRTCCVAPTRAGGYQRGGSCGQLTQHRRPCRASVARVKVRCSRSATPARLPVPDVARRIFLKPRLPRLRPRARCPAQTR